MEDLFFFIKGIVIGFAIAVPVGPIGMLCIRRTLEKGRWSGFFSGLGAACADSFYGLVAALGLSMITEFIWDYQTLLKVFGGIFLLVLGVKTLLRKHPKEPVFVTSRNLFADFITTFLLTLTNPATIISFVAIFAALGLVEHQGRHVQTFTLVLGVFIGSSVWWLLLSEGVTSLRKRASERVLHLINRIAGFILILFALLAFISIAWQ